MAVAVGVRSETRWHDVVSTQGKEGPEERPGERAGGEDALACFQGRAASGGHRGGRDRRGDGARVADHLACLPDRPSATGLPERCLCHPAPGAPPPGPAAAGADPALGGSRSRAEPACPGPGSDPAGSGAGSVDRAGRSGGPAARPAPHLGVGAGPGGPGGGVAAERGRAPGLAGNQLCRCLRIRDASVAGGMAAARGAGGFRASDPADGPGHGGSEPGTASPGIPGWVRRWN